jgi:hypothetical protein
MKTFTFTHKVLAIFMMAILCLFSLTMKAQTIQIDSLFTSDGEIFPFGTNDSIYGLDISGHVTLSSDTSLVRVILTDNSGNEWMVYEAYPMIVEDWVFDIESVCDETCYLEEFHPYSLIIQIIDAEINISFLSSSNRWSSNLSALQFLAKANRDLLKVQHINNYIAREGWEWIADTTQLVKLYCYQKSEIFHPKYNLLGRDYYSGGEFYSIRHKGIPPIYETTIIPEFDWRHKHNADIEGSLYFNDDGEVPPNGWMTGLRNQVGESCSAFAGIASLEAAINLYANYHFDIEKNVRFSERDAFNCSSYNENNDFGCKINEGKVIDYILNKFQNDGVVDQGCFPNETDPPSPFCLGEPLDCLQIPEEIRCSDPDWVAKIAPWKPINNFPTNSTQEEKAAFLKKLLIDNGPLIIELRNYPTPGDFHAVSLVGFAFNENTGKIHWKFKDSGGPGGYGAYGDETFSLLQDPLHHEAPYITNKIYSFRYDDPEPISIIADNFHLEVNDVDLDKDGYYNWGIGQKTATYDCNQDEDSNDDRKLIGPYEDDYLGTSIKPEMQVYMMRSAGKLIVENNSFFSFLSNDRDTENKIKFYIENLGTAQLNLQPFQIAQGKIEIIPIPGASPNFAIYNEDHPKMKICWGFEKRTEFKISFNGSDLGELTKIKIYVDENGDIPDFEFIIVYNDCLPATNLIQITTDTFWDSYALKNDDYLITNGANLTVTGQVAMAENSDIFIDAGAKIIIDGGRLTSSCNSLWNGIDVWGEARMPQIRDNQGMVEIRNGGTIEFAKTGISTAEFYGIYASPSGGIISCVDGIFRDNITDVEFYPYTNYHPQYQNWLPNFSRFIKTRFETTDDLYNIFSEIPDRHLAMDGVDGIYIYGCTFGNYSSQLAGSRGIGVESNQSGYTIDRVCIENLIYPCTEWQPCLFENLDYGVLALNGIGRYPITVNNTDFIDNHMGIFLGLVYDATIIRNHFELNADDDYFQSGEKLVGIYSQFCPRYQIEENTITGGDPEHFELIGMHIVNSGAEYYNEIYNNILTNLDNGITASGENRDEDGKGLCIKCNDFVGCNIDVAVLPNGGETPKKLGIAFLQGDISPEPPAGEDPDQTVSAGNTFSVYNSSEVNYSNDLACNPIQYTYHGQNPGDYKIRPFPTNPAQPTENLLLRQDNPVTYSKPSSCPSNLGGGGITPLVESNKLSNELVLVEKYKDTLNMYVDGGDTPSLQSQVQTSSPDEALSIQQQLIDESPFLSDTVMITAIEKEDVLPNAMIRDVLTLNPQSAKNDHILDKLDERMLPMPDYMIDEIKQNENIFGPKELLEQKLDDHKSKRDISLAKLCRYYKTDTINTTTSFDSLEYILFNTWTLGTRYELLLQHLNINDSLNSYATINDIPLSFDLTSQQYDELTLYEELTNIIFAINKDSVRFDTTSINSLYDMYLINRGIPSEFSKHFLVYHHYLSFNEPIYLPSILKASPVIKHHVIQAKKDDLINVYPNPCKNYIILDYNVPENPNSCNNIKLTDLQGRSLKQVELTDFKNQIILPVSDLADGIYLIQLFTGNKLKKTVKFSILK